MAITAHSLHVYLVYTDENPYLIALNNQLNYMYIYHPPYSN
jgi:hypothetical protein